MSLIDAVKNACTDKRRRGVEYFSRHNGDSETILGFLKQLPKNCTILWDDKKLVDGDGSGLTIVIGDKEVVCPEMVPKHEVCDKCGQTKDVFTEKQARVPD